MLLNLTHEVICGSQPEFAGAEALLATDLPDLDQQQSEVKQGAGLVLISDGSTNVELFLQDLFARVVVA